VPGLLEVCLLDHGSSPRVAGRLQALARALTAERAPVRLVRAERALTDDQALLLAAESAPGERVLVQGDEVEAAAGEGLLDGLLWLLDDAGAATASPTLVSRAQASCPDPAELREQHRASALPRAAFLARRR